MEIFKKNRALINQMVSDSFRYLQTVYSQGTQLFTFASAWGQVVLVAQNIAQLMMVFIEDSITELNIYEASRASSIYNWARLSGHSPTRAISAKGSINVTWNKYSNLDSGGGAVIIPNYTKVVCTNNGLLYSLKLNSDQVKIPLSGNINQILPLVQGTIYSQTFTSTGEALQSFNYSARGGVYVDNYDIQVYVNGEKWKKYESIYDMNYVTKGFLVKTGISQGIDIYFGTGNMGMIPNPGAIIKVDAIINDGIKGTIDSSEPTKVSFKFTDPGLDLFGNEVNLNDYLNIQTEIIPTLGSDPEPIELTRLIAPRTSKNYVFATPDNYTMYLEKFNLFSIIKSYTTFEDENLDDDNVVYILLVPDVKKTMKSSEDYFSLTDNRFLLNRNQKRAISELLYNTGSIIGNTVIQILDPVLSKYVINMRLTTFQGYDRNIISDKIRSAISDYFIGIRRIDKIPKSDIISLVEQIPGVDSVNLEFVGKLNEEAQKAYNDKLAASGLTSVLGTTPVGIDSFGDIVMARGQVAQIQGGWSDRYGNYYEVGIIQGKSSSLNIEYVGQPVDVTYNVDYNDNLKNTIKNSDR
jgi:hypothetical protein